MRMRGLVFALVVCAACGAAVEDIAVAPAPGAPLATLVTRGYRLRLQGPDSFDVLRADGTLLAEGLSGAELYVAYPDLELVLEQGFAARTIDASVNLALDH
jgi:hypothetical protein